MKRRDFVSALGLGAPLLMESISTLTAGQPSSPPQTQTGKGRPKIGCVSWCFHTLAPGGHPEEAIDIIGSLGHRPRFAFQRSPALKARLNHAGDFACRK